MFNSDKNRGFVRKIQKSLSFPSRYPLPLFGQRQQPLLCTLVAPPVLELLGAGRQPGQPRQLPVQYGRVPPEREAGPIRLPLGEGQVSGVARTDYYEVLAKCP